MPGNQKIELRDPVHGPIEVGAAELDVIDAPLFQRLRGVKQLGFAELVFPGALHNRYLHSVGAMHLAGRAFDAAFAAATGLSQDTKAAFRQIIRLAGLLHDVGHAPLSHAAEALMPMREDLNLDPAFGYGPGKASHEEMSLKLLLDSPLTQVIDGALSPHGFNARHIVAVLGDTDTYCEGDFVSGGVDYRPLLHALVAGEMDVDRMDYLLRDSLFTGVSYGNYDLHWLLSNLGFVVDEENKARVAMDLRALTSFEHFLLARYHMFQMVYFHPKSDIYDAMLRRWLDNVGDAARFPADPNEFVHCTDAWLMNRLDTAEDPWARRVRDRNPLALAIEFRTEAQRRTRDSIAEELEAKGTPCLWLTAKPVLSRYAQSPKKMARNPLFVRDHQTHNVLRIEDVTDLFGRYESTVRTERLYVNRDDRDNVRALAKSLGA